MIGELDNGDIEVVSSARQGDIVNIKVIPKEGYRLKSINIELGEDDTFIMPGYHLEIQAEFERFSYICIYDDIEHGIITVNMSQAAFGEEIIIQAIPDEGYRLKDNRVYIYSQFNDDIDTWPNYKLTDNYAKVVNTASDKVLYAVFEPIPASVAIDYMELYLPGLGMFWNIKFSELEFTSGAPKWNAIDFFEDEYVFVGEDYKNDRYIHKLYFSDNENNIFDLGHEAQIALHMYHQYDTTGGRSFPRQYKTNHDPILFTPDLECYVEVKLLYHEAYDLWAKIYFKLIER